MTRHFVTYLTVILSLATASACLAGGATVVYDFVDRYPDAKVSNAMSPGAKTAISGSVPKPSIFLHTQLPGETTAEYSIELPRIGAGERLVMLYSVGLTDGIKINDASHPFDGVSFELRIDGKKDFQANLMECGWVDGGTDLTPRAGKRIKVAFVTQANKNSNYDWALWGAPQILRLTKSVLAGDTAPAAKGVVVARPSADSTLTITPVGQSSRQNAHPITVSLKKDRLAAVRFDYLSSGVQSVKINSGGAKDLGVYAFSPQISIVSFGPTSALAYRNKPVTLRAVVKNYGEGALTASEGASVTFGHSASGAPIVRGDEVLATISSLPVGALLPGESKTVECSFTPPANSAEARLAAIVTSADAQKSVAQKTVAFAPAPSITDKPGDALKVERLADGSVVLRNAKLRMQLLKSSAGFVAWILSVPKDDTWQQASSGSFGTLTASIPSDGAIESRLYPADARVATDSVTLTLSRKIGSAPCTFEWTFKIAADQPKVSVAHSMKAGQQIEILHFSGPTVYAGDGSFGRQKDEGLFPGLEYLLTEQSSGTEFVSPPNDLRTVPHPNKVTIPFMAVRSGSTLVMLEWDPMQKWDGKADRPSPVFASSNFVDGQDNHLMGIFAPSVPDWTPENKLLAEKPYVLAAGKSIRLEATLCAKSDSISVIDALDEWIAGHGLPEPPKVSKKPIEMLNLCDQAFLQSSWDSAAKAWKHTITGPITFDGMIANYLYARDNRTIDEEISWKIQDVVKPAVKPVLESIPLNTAFYAGNLPAALDRESKQMESLIASQSEDGSWPYTPDEKHAALGKAGDTSSGWTALRARQLLEYALITDDEKAIEAGLKALTFLDAQTRPEGAQTWELQLHVPDILASAHLVRSYLAAFRITDEKQYLDRAVYWAKTGLPFVYLWNAPDQPIMRYGTIPVLGATWFNGQPWFGVIVQWCGLEYGYALDKLSEFDQTLPWKQVSRGILYCGVQQQEYTTREYPANAGMYPDAYSPIKGKEEYHWDINPRLIARNLLRDAGFDSEPTTHGVRDRRSQLMTFTLPVQKFNMRYEKEFLWIDFPYVEGATIHLVVGGIWHPETFDLNGNVVPLYEDISLVPYGWQWDDEKKVGILKIKTRTQNQLVIDLIQHESHRLPGEVDAPLEEPTETPEEAPAEPQ